MSTNALTCARSALALASSNANDEAYWSHVAASLGLPGRSVADAAASIADETGAFAAAARASGWRGLVALYVEMQSALGAGPTSEPVALTPISVLPTRGRGAHPSVAIGNYDSLLSRTTLGDTQVGVVQDEGLLIVRNRGGAIWSLDLHPDHWGQFLWGVPAPAGTQTLTVLAHDEYLFVQRLDVVSTFESSLDVWKRDPVRTLRGQYVHIGRFDGHIISGSPSGGAIVDVPLPLACAGRNLAILRPDGTIAVVDPDTQTLVSITALPPSVQNRVSGAPVSIHLDLGATGSVLITVPGDVLEIELSSGQQQWSLRAALEAGSIVHRLHLGPGQSAADADVRPGLREAELQPVDMPPAEAIGKREALNVAFNETTLVIAAAKALVVVPRLGSGAGASSDTTRTNAMVLTLPVSPRTSWGKARRRPFYGPSSQLGSRVSLSGAHALWLTQHAPFLLVLQDRHGKDGDCDNDGGGDGDGDGDSGDAGHPVRRVLDLWSGVESACFHTPTHFDDGDYGDAMRSVISRMVVHQDWAPTVVLTRTAAYLLGTLRGQPADADSLAPQANILVSWDFGVSALSRASPAALHTLLAARLRAGAAGEGESAGEGAGVGAGAGVDANRQHPIEHLGKGLAETHLVQ